MDKKVIFQNYTLQAGNTYEKLVGTGSVQLQGIQVINATGSAAKLYLVNDSGDGKTGWDQAGHSTGIPPIRWDAGDDQGELVITIAANSTYESPDWMSGLVFPTGLIIWAETSTLLVHIFLLYSGYSKQSTYPGKAKGTPGVAKNTFIGHKRPSRIAPQIK